MKQCILRKGIFDRWFIFHPSRAESWSGSRWVECSPNGMPTGKFQVCNFTTEAEAREYCHENGLEPIAPAL